MKMKALIGVLVALVLGVAFYFLLYQPKADEQELLEQETAQLEQQQQQLRNQIEQLERIQANEVEIRAALARLEEFIPSGPAQPTVIRQFQLTADAAGVEIESVSFEPPAPVAGAPATGEPDTALAQIPLAMVLRGGYFQMVDFFRRLEVDVPRAALVTSIAVAEDAEDEFPTLATTWGGNLFAVVPVAATAVTPVPGATEGATPAPTETTDVDVDVDVTEGGA